VNYIREINAFYDWLELNELSASAVNLWYALMHINNKAGWAETFTVAESVLCVKTQLTDRTVRNARNELKQKGRIDFKSRKGGRSPIYYINSFETPVTLDYFSEETSNLTRSKHIKSTEIVSAETSEDKKTTEMISSDVSDGLSEDVSGDTSGVVSVLIKQNKTKQNKTKQKS
jgi:hypothetical protein